MSNQHTANVDPTAPTGEASVGTSDMGTQSSVEAPNSTPNAGGGTDTGITGDGTAGGGLTGGDQADAGNLSRGTKPIPSGQ